MGKDYEEAIAGLEKLLRWNPLPPLISIHVLPKLFIEIMTGNEHGFD